MRSLECLEGQEVPTPEPGCHPQQITAWVRAHFTAETAGGVTVYDLIRTR